VLDLFFEVRDLPAEILEMLVQSFKPAN